MADGYTETYKELIETTDWSKYGRGNDPRCDNCMAHCGYEPTAVLAASKSLKQSVRALVAHALSISSLSLRRVTTARTPDRFAHVPHPARASSEYADERVCDHPRADVGLRQRRARRAVTSVEATSLAQRTYAGCLRRRTGLVDRPVCATRAISTSACRRSASREPRDRAPLAARARAHARARPAGGRRRRAHRDVRAVPGRARAAVGRVRHARGPPREEPRAPPRGLRGVAARSAIPVGFLATLDGQPAGTALAVPVRPRRLPHRRLDRRVGARPRRLPRARARALGVRRRSAARPRSSRTRCPTRRIRSCGVSASTRSARSGASKTRHRARRRNRPPRARCISAGGGPTTVTEAELIARAKRGDAAAYEELVRIYQGIAFRTAWLVAGNGGRRRGGCAGRLREGVPRAVALPRRRAVQAVAAPHRRRTRRATAAAPPAAARRSRCARPGRSSRGTRPRPPRRRSSTRRDATSCSPP